MNTDCFKKVNITEKTRKQNNSNKRKINIPKLIEKNCYSCWYLNNQNMFCSIYKEPVFVPIDERNCPHYEDNY